MTFKNCGPRAKRKWAQLHEAFVKQHKVQRASIPEDIKLQLGPRASDALQIACGRQGINGSQDFMADVSQSVHRVRLRTDGSAPTLTPAGKFVYRRCGRMAVLMPRQHLHLHSFPWTSLTVPATVSDHQLQDLSWNSMHLKAVTVAILLAMSSVDFAKAGVRVRSLPATPAGSFLTMLRWDSRNNCWQQFKQGGGAPPPKKAFVGKFRQQVSKGRPKAPPKRGPVSKKKMPSMKTKDTSLRQPCLTLLQTSCAGKLGGLYS